MTSIFPYALMACAETALRYLLSRWKYGVLMGDGPGSEPGTIQTQNTGAKQ
jgi:hypothetical protein